MKRVLLGAGGLLVLLSSLVCGGMALATALTPTYAEQQLKLDAERAAAARDAAQAATLAPVVTALWAILWSAVAVVVVVLAGAAVVRFFMWLDTYRLTRAQARLVWAEEGLYPVPAAALLNGRAYELARAGQAGYWQARITEAANVGTPEHYAPAISYEYANRQDTPAGAGVPQLAAAPPFVAPSIGEAAERGAFRDGRYIMGYAITDGAPATLDQENGRSFLLAGQGGSGGTTALLAAGLQEILMPLYLAGQQESARFLIIDYHARKVGGLLRRIGDELGDRVIATAHTPNEVMRVTSYFEAECKARVDGAPTPYTLILLADEIGNLLDDADYADVAPKLLAAFAHANNAYRAVGGKAIVRCHTLQASAWGNSAAVRQSFHARSGMRLDEGAGILLGLKPAIARTLLALPAGQSYVTGPGLAPTHVVSSNVRRGDIGLVLDLAGDRAKARTVHPVAVRAGAAADQVPSDTPAAGPPWWEIAAARGAPGRHLDSTLTPTDATDGTPADPYTGRCVALFLAGRSLKEICELMHPEIDSKSGGRPYRDKRDALEDLIRQELARRRQGLPADNT